MGSNHVITRLISPSKTQTIAGAEPGNLTASENFTSDWVLCEEDGGITIVLAYAGELSSATLEWSSDGITGNGVTNDIKEQDAGGGVKIYVIQTQAVYEYFRVNVTDSGSGSTVVISEVSTQKDPPAPSLFTTDTEIGPFDVASLVRAIFTGEEVDGLLQPTGTFGNVELVNGSIKAAIPWELLLKYATPTDAALPSGSDPAIDPVLNAEANVIDTGWLPARAFPGGNFIVVNSNVALDVYLANASDDSGNNPVGLAVPNITVAPGVPAVISAAFFDDYFRAIVVNHSGSSATELSIRSMGLQAPAPSVVFSVDQEIPSFTPAAVVQSINKGQTPDDTFRALRIQGRSSTNSSITPLNGDTGGSDHIFRGLWFEWQDSYVGLISECRSDVAGSFIIDFSTQESPVDGDETGVDFTITVPYDPSAGNGTLRRHTPIQSRWVRVRYENGVTAQSIFELDCAFITTAPPDVTEPLSTIPQDESLAGIERVKQFAADSSGDLGFIGRGGAGEGLDSHITGHEVDTPVSTMRDFEVGQGTANASTRVTIPPPAFEDVKGISIANLNNDVRLWMGKSGVTRLDGDVIFPATKEHFETSGEETIYLITDPGAGASAQYDLNADTVDTNSGVTSPSNLFAQDATYATFNDEGDYVDISGFDATGVQVLDEVSSLILKMRGKKDSTPASQTITHVETLTGTTSGATSVVSGSIASGSNLLVIASVARNAANTVSGVNDGDLVFTRVVPDVQVSDKRLDIWYAVGTTTGGPITATMSSSTRATISVSVFTGADQTTTVEAAGTGQTGTGTIATGSTLAKTQDGLGFLAVLHQAASASAGTGYTERSDITNGTGSNTVNLATETKLFSSTGSESATMNLATSEIWAAAGITIYAGGVTDPVITVTNDQGSTVAEFTLSSTSDTDYEKDITADVMDYADIDAMVLTVEASTLGAADALIDHVYLDLTESEEGTSVRFSYKWLGVD